MRIFIIISAVCIFNIAIGNAQDKYTYNNQNPLSNSLDFEFGKCTISDLQTKRFERDTTADALILNEFGKAFFISNTVNPPIQFEYHVKIKIFNKNALSNGTVEIPLYTRDRGSYEKFRYAKGITYYEENGKMKSASLKESQIQTIEIDEHHSKIKFTLPEIKEGCVLEYRYVTETPYIDTFKTWRFQSNLPKLKSTFEVSIPQIVGYDVKLMGPLKLTENTFDEVPRCYFFNGVVYNCLHAVYSMQNIPAFQLQPGMKTARGFRSAIYFQITDMLSLSNFTDRNYAVRQNVAKNWKDFGTYLRYKDNFGGELKKKFPFKQELKKITSDAETELQKAVAVYKYVQQNLAWNGYKGIFSDDETSDIFKNVKGTIADINISLISALNAAGIDAKPVLISTVDNGRINKNAPSLNDLNYIIATVTIDNKVYFADATDKTIKFGELPERAQNYEGRVIDFDGDDYWADIPVAKN